MSGGGQRVSDVDRSILSPLHTILIQLSLLTVSTGFPDSNFNQMVGTYEELQAYLREYVEQLSISDERRNAA